MTILRRGRAGRALFALMTLTLLGRVASADTAPPEQAAALLPETTSPILAADLEAHVRGLASPQMAGRRAGEAGDRLASAYVAAAFERIGLAPGGPDGSFFEPFEFPAGVSLGPHNRLEIRRGRPGARGALRAASPQLNQDWRPLGFSAQGPMIAEVAFVGYGLNAAARGDLPAYDSYASRRALAGRWALVWRGAPPDASSARREHLLDVAGIRFKASVARAHGAVGLIVADGPGAGFAPGLPALRMAPGAARETIPVIAFSAAAAAALLRAGGLDPAAEAARLADGRSPAPPQVLSDVAVAAAVDLQIRTLTSRNVLARLSLGGEPAAAPVILGAHLDHLGAGDARTSLAQPEEAGQLHLGADDNASGVAALLEIAEAMAAERREGGLTGRRDIVFAAWSAEELGLIGAKRHIARRLAESGAPNLKGSVAAYLNMDMIGRLRENRLEVEGVGSASVWADDVTRFAIERHGFAAKVSRDAFLPTDATPFYLAGAPILSVSTGVHDAYHTPRDVADLLNYPGLERVARLMRSMVVARAKGAAPVHQTVAQSASPNTRRDGSIYLGALPDFLPGPEPGVLLAAVVEDGPAQAAGVVGGDRLMRLAGEEILNLYDLVRVLNGLTPDEPVVAVINRAGLDFSLEVTPRARARP